ncbi:FAD:protein FMN transferase [Streptomyces sp. NPDC060027]|uniref:FAD:protein FMN transferase n=1 Tax=Streptomyces sp. NPDC060027 TaxID=3347040 RepID=UPI003692F7D2
MKAADNVPIVRHRECVMDMPISVALRGRHAGDAAGRRAWRGVIQEWININRVFSRDLSDSVISQFNRGEVTEADCPPEVQEVMALGAHIQRESHGAFSVYRRGTNGRMHLRPNGVVKGWAVERCAAHLQELADTDFCLSAGGDMHCRSLDPNRPWRIGIEDPHQVKRVLAVLPVLNGGVATSGTAYRGNHIVDARTGRPPTHVAQVTVFADSVTWADVDATAAFALGPEAAAWLSGRAGRTGLVVWQDGSTSTID